MSRIDWSVYPTQYDFMAERNPAYQEILNHCVTTVKSWPLEVGEVLADFGAGTGNFSIALARALPDVTVLHLERDSTMFEIATRKARQAAVDNWRAVRLDLDDENWDLPPLAAAVTVHCLCSTKQPSQLIQRLCGQLRPGGHLYACDIGRVTNVTGWACYMLGASLRTRGVLATLTLLVRSRIILKQNRLADAARRNGTYWTHSLTEFKSCFKQAGINVSFASNEFYRGCDDLVIGQKI